MQGRSLVYGSCPKYLTSLYARPTFPRFTAQGYNTAGKPILSEGQTPEMTQDSKILALSASVEFKKKRCCLKWGRQMCSQGPQRDLNIWLPLSLKVCRTMSGHDQDEFQAIGAGAG